MALERTLILVKPDGVQRRLTGRIVSRIEDKGLQIVAMKMLQISPAMSRQHYAEHVEKPFYPDLEQFITSGPVVALVVQGPEVVSVMRTLMGSTNSRVSAPGTIRGDYGASRQMNLIHGSDSVESALREIAVYFGEGEVYDFSATLNPWTWAAEEA